MSGKAVVKPDALPDLDDLLQCPVCYEIPSGHIFQCNEGHHVCGGCKVRLDVCPVCRALFFGTRNYAMEELIASMKKLRAFKLGGKVTTGSGSSESSTPAREVVSDETENTTVAADEDDLQVSSQSTVLHPQLCKGLFRCLCCKDGNAVRLPSGRLINHLRYFHSSELIEGKSENGEYIQAWQFSTDPGRITTAVRVADMGIFFLIIEIGYESVCAWLRMIASHWVSQEFVYTVTISGNDREAIFSDNVWSVRSCEGSLKKRGHCLFIDGADATALVLPANISGKILIRRAPPDQEISHLSQPRTVMRVATRGIARESRPTASTRNELQPFIQGLQNDVARLHRAFEALGRETHAILRTEDELHARVGITQNRQNILSNLANRSTSTQPDNGPTSTSAPRSTSTAADTGMTSDNREANEQQPQMSRSARRRMRNRMRAALNETHLQEAAQVTPQQGNSREAESPTIVISGLAIIQENPLPSSTINQNATNSPSNGLPNNNPNVRVNKKNRRHRR